MKVSHDTNSWEFDDLEDFLAEYRATLLAFRHATISVYVMERPEQTIARKDRFPLQLGILGLRCDRLDTTVDVQAASRADINRALAYFQDSRERGRFEQVPSTYVQAVPPLKIFIGHGRSPIWRELKDHLVDHHGYQVVTYESGARAGHVIRDVLDDMLQTSSFAILIMAGEDETAEGGIRARQNVVHEVGLFQGKIGFSRAIALVEEDVEVFSNLQGVSQVRFSKDNIREAYGEVLATLRREFGDRR